MSTLRVNTLQTQAGVEVYTAKAWVNFNGTGTVAIRAAGNVSSITDNGTGDYTVNFTTAMTDINYSFIVSGELMTVFGYGATAPTTTAYRFDARVPSTSASVDRAFINVAVFR